MDIVLQLIAAFILCTFENIKNRRNEKKNVLIWHSKADWRIITLL